MASLVYRPGWVFKLGGPGREMLCIFARTADTLHPERQRTTQHQFAIPAEAAGDLPAFARWVLARLMQVERHEAAEWLQVAGRRPFWPNHQDEGSPYEPVERW